jgi:hypothetical protein
MIVLKMLLAAIAFVLLIGPLNAHANIIYNWTGDCQGIAAGFNTGCTGQATLHVVTTDAYIPGQVLFGDTPHVLLEALYSDSTLTFDLGIQWPSSGESFLLLRRSPETGLSLFKHKHSSRTPKVSGSLKARHRSSRAASVPAVLIHSVRTRP